MLTTPPRRLLLLVSLSLSPIIRDQLFTSTRARTSLYSPPLFRIERLMAKVFEYCSDIISNLVCNDPFHLAWLSPKSRDLSRFLTQVTVSHHLEIIPVLLSFCPCVPTPLCRCSLNKGYQRWTNRPGTSISTAWRRVAEALEKELIIYLNFSVTQKQASRQQDISSYGPHQQLSSAAMYCQTR